MPEFPISTSSRRSREPPWAAALVVAVQTWGADGCTGDLGEIVYASVDLVRSGLAPPLAALTQAHQWQPRLDLRGPRADSRSAPEALASTTCSSPVASSSHVRGSVSTTLGGVPRVCLGPETHCTATNGGMRTSTLAPGACAANVRAVSRTAAARYPHRTGDRVGVVA